MALSKKYEMIIKTAVLLSRTNQTIDNYNRFPSKINSDSEHTNNNDNAPNDNKIRFISLINLIDF